MSCTVFGDITKFRANILSCRDVNVPNKSYPPNPVLMIIPAMHKKGEEKKLAPIELPGVCTES